MLKIIWVFTNVKWLKHQPLIFSSVPSSFFDFAAASAGDAIGLAGNGGIWKEKNS